MVGLSLNIPDNFFSEEIRCEYKVSAKLKKIWAVELDLLDKFLAFCSEHEIKVIAWAGTLLGAVRHKGFIPWDDDADIAMTRENFEKLLKIISKKQFDYPYFLQTAYNDKKFFFGYARFRNSETTGHIIGNDSSDYNNGIYIDVYVLDGYGTTEKEQKLHIKKKQKWERLIIIGYGSLQSKSSIKKVIKMFLRPVIRFFWTYDSLLEKYDANMKLFKNSEKIGIFTHQESLMRKYWCSPKDFDEIIYADFEMIKIPIPKNYDEILTHMYGNYMEYPPVEKRGLWHDSIIYFDPDVPYKKYFEKTNGEK